jgi:cellulose synthase/poly-beta-1,6-N-acetylglucosamine synthase-like glycosyltransferase
MRNHPGARVTSDWSIAVFCPCKGVDHEFEKNIRSILEQDYPRFSVYFIVESAEDPAYRLLKDIGARSVLIAGEASDCGQKVHNLAYAVRQVGLAANIYVFCDSDARYPVHWLRELTAPLQDGKAVVTTGYRWYIVRTFHIPSILRSAWNSTVLGVLGDHDRNFAWGGSTAILRETFENIRVLVAWRGALSDDYAITRAAQSAGVHIRFVPSCLIPSYGKCSFRELLEFTNRQIIITRVYHRQLWILAFAAQTVFNVTFWSLLATLLWAKTPVVFVLWLAIFALSAARSGVRVFAVKSRLGDPSMSRFAWIYVLSSPIVALLYQFNMLCSAITRDIEWRQIQYTLMSPNETRVRRMKFGV